MHKTSRFRWLGMGLMTGLLSVAQASAPVVGSVAVYSDGTAERLLAINGDQQVWEDNRLRRITRSVNPIAPPLQRDRRLTGKTDYRLQRRAGDPDAIFKAPQGSTVEFSYWRERAQGQRDLKPREYKCVYQGEHQQLWREQALQIAEYACDRFVTHHKLWTQDVKDSFVISYSRKLKMPIEVVRVKNGQRQSKRLLALLSPTQYSYERLRDIQKKASKKVAG